MTRVVLFNGPPGSGKDESVKFALSHFPNSEKHQFKDKLFEITCVLFDVEFEELTGRMYTRQAKELPHIELNGLSPREALIFVSENIIKPHFSEGYFGEALAHKVSDTDADFVFIPDSGFLDEALELLEVVPADQIFVIRLHRDGCDFSKDSRDYLDDDDLFEYGIHSVDVDNNGSRDDLRDEVIQLIEQFAS